LAAEQHLTIVAAELLAGGQPDLVEALGDGRFGFVGGKDALARLDELLGDSIQLRHASASCWQLDCQQYRERRSGQRLYLRLMPSGERGCRAAMPGGGLPSIRSRKAPPAVET